MDASDQGQGIDMYTAVYMPVCPGIYAKKINCMQVQNCEIRTDDLVHSKRHIIPLCYKRAPLGDISCLYKILIH